MGRDAHPRLIGILAGMGPRSTAPFVDMLVDECQRQYGARYDIDFPPMLIYALPTPFYVDRPIDHAALEAAIARACASWKMPAWRLWRCRVIARISTSNSWLPACMCRC